MLVKWNIKKLVIGGGAVIISLALILTYWWFESRDVVTTDDAYVSGNNVNISSQIPGSVKSINFVETDYVKEGDILLTLDDLDATIKYNEAKHALASIVRSNAQKYIDDLIYQSQVSDAKISLKQAENDYARRVALKGAAAIPKEDLLHAKNLVDKYQMELQIAIQTYKSNHILIQNTALEKQPEVMRYADQLRQAWINLQRTEIKSPVTGYIAQRSVQVGETVSEGQELMSIVPAAQMWVNANFKETQLQGVKAGQEVQITTDFYGKNVIFHGAVAGISMGTGSAFSLLPAQNASGNWIKIVQRVPVKILLQPEQVEQYQLRIGLSGAVKINKSVDTGSEILPVIPVYSTDVLRINTTRIDLEINDIIKLNSK